MNVKISKIRLHVIPAHHATSRQHHGVLPLPASSPASRYWLGRPRERFRRVVRLRPVKIGTEDPSRRISYEKKVSFRPSPSFLLATDYWLLATFVFMLSLRQHQTRTTTRGTGAAQRGCGKAQTRGGNTTTTNAEGRYKNEKRAIARSMFLTRDAKQAIRMKQLGGIKKD